VYQLAIVKLAGLPTMAYEGSRKAGGEVRSQSQKYAPSIQGRRARARRVAS
jgi:hypothetical protein